MAATKVVIIDDDGIETNDDSNNSSYYCRYCDKYFSSAVFRNRQQFGAHCSNCSRHRKLRGEEVVLGTSSPVMANLIHSPTITAHAKPMSTRLRRHRTTQPNYHPPRRYRVDELPAHLSEDETLPICATTTTESVDRCFGPITATRSASGPRRCMQPGAYQSDTGSISMAPTSGMLGSPMMMMPVCTSPYMYGPHYVSSFPGMHDFQVGSILSGPKDLAPPLPCPSFLLPSPSLPRMSIAAMICTKTPTPDQSARLSPHGMSESRQQGKKKTMSLQSSTLWECLLNVAGAEQGE